MNVDFIKGVITPVVTPIDENEKVKEGTLRQIVEHILNGGVHGMLAMGSNSEFYGLEREQQEQVTRLLVEYSKGRVPVYLGIGEITTRECVRWAKKAESFGVDAISVLHPMFIGPNDDEMYQHFKTIAEATDLPVLLYNNPDRMRCGLSANVIDRLADIPNIVGVKESSGDMTLTAEFIRRTRDRNFRVIAGRDIMVLSTLVYGGVGTVASTSNVVPELVVSIYEKYIAGDLAGALEAQYQLAPMRMAYNLASFPVVTKDYMRILGFDVGEPVKPNLRSSEENLAVLKAQLTALGAKRLD